MKESIFVIIVVIGIILVAYIGETQEPVPPYSSRNKGYTGTLALYMLLDKYTQVNRVYVPLNNIPEGTLVVIEPVCTMNQKETEYIFQWVEKGNTLVVFSDNPRIMRTFGVELSSSNNTYAVLSPEYSHASTKNVQEISVLYTHYFSNHSGKVLFAHDKNPVCIVISRGAGEIVLVSTPSLVQNIMISAHDNEIFLVYLLLSETVSFDEYHLTEPKGGLNIKTLTGVFSSRYSTFFIQFILVIILFLMAYGNRFGSARPVPPPDVQSAELVELAADIYYKAGKKEVLQLQEGDKNGR
ncbi:MAG: DUF4350 domain-containing protein [Candidatus Methanofastidiosia archaeon]|jgi:hypothetical protein